MISSFLILLLSTSSFVGCTEADRPVKSRRLPPEPELAPSSQVRDVSDILDYNVDDKEWPKSNQNKKNPRVDEVAASQLSKDRITALFGAEAKPAYGHRDPETGKVNLSPSNIQDRQGLSKKEEVDRVGDDIAEPENNEINPFQLFPPSFHDLLNIPIHDYGNGSTLNPYEKFNKKPKQPLISSGYANTKLQGGKGADGQDDSFEEHTQKPKKVKYRTTTTEPPSDYDYEPTKRPVKQRKPLRPKPTPEPTHELEYSSEEHYRDETRIPYRPVTDEPKAEEPPLYITTRLPVNSKQRPKPVDVDSFEDVRTYSRPYDEERYPPKQKTRRPEATTYRGESQSEEKMPKYVPKPPTSEEYTFYQNNPVKNSRPEPVVKKPQAYDDDIIYDYDDERNTGDKAVYFHVSKPESDILRETNSHGLPPHAAKQDPAAPAEEFRPVVGPRPQQNAQYPVPNSDVSFPRPAPRPGNNQQFTPDAKRNEQFKQDSPPIRSQAFPSVFNSDSPFSTPGVPQSNPRQPFGAPFSQQGEQRRPYPGPTETQRVQEAFRPVPVRHPEQRPHPEQRQPDNRFRNPHPLQDGFQGSRPQQGDVFYQRPLPHGEHRNDYRQPPREQSSGPLSSITNMFSSLFGRKGERSKRSVDDIEMDESKELSSIVKLDRSELRAIQIAKEQVAAEQEGTPPHFYYYPPGRSIPLLVVGPVLDTDAPHVEGAELVHVAPIDEADAESNNPNKRQVYSDSDRVKKLPSITSILQKKPSLDQPPQPLAQKPTATRTGVVFPKKKSEVSRKPIEAVLDPVNSELSIPENVGVVQEEDPEESLSIQVSQAVKNTVKKLNPLQLLRSKEQKNGVVTPTGEPGNPALARPAKAGSVPDIPFAEPIKLAPQSQGQFLQQAKPPLLQPLPPASIAKQNYLPAAAEQKPFSSPSNSDQEVTKPSSDILKSVVSSPVEQEVEVSQVENDDLQDDPVDELPVAEKYVRIPVKTQLSENGVFIIEAAPVQDKIQERADTVPVQDLPSKEAGQPGPNQQEKSRQNPSISSLPPLNFPTEFFKQISELKPPQDLATPITIHQPTPSESKPPLFPLGSSLPGLVQDRPELQPAQPLPIIQARPPQPSSKPLLQGAPPPPPKASPVFFPPQLTMDDSKPVANITKFSSKFNPETVKKFKVGADGKPLNLVRPPQPTTTEKLNTLPPGVTPGPPKLLGLDAPFIPSQKVNQAHLEDSVVEESQPVPFWQALGNNVEKREDNPKEGSAAPEKLEEPFIEIGGFVPIFPQ